MISFDSAKFLTYDRTNQYFGESVMYAVEQHFVIEGDLLTLQNQEGVAGIWAQIDNFAASAVDDDSIVVNGTNFGPGRINSINFASGNDVRRKTYTADITVFSTGDLPPNLAPLLPNIHLTEGFSESFDYSITEDGEFQYRHSISVKYNKGGVISDPIAAAKTLAAGLFDSPPAYGFIDNHQSQLYNGSGKHTYTENYNKITNECSFTKSFQKGRATDGVVIKMKQELQTGEDGISTVTESARIEDVTDFSIGVNVSQAYSRSAALLITYMPQARPLNSGHISLEKTINRFARTIDYTVRFNNDPRNLTTYSWEYTKEISRGEECFFTIKESGVVSGLSSNCTKADRYNRALAGWSTVKSGIGGRSTAYYKSITGLDNPLKLLSSTESRAVYRGEISYDFSYTDDTTIKTGDIKKIEIQITDHPPIPLYNRFAVARVGEVVQSIGLVKEGKRSVSIKMLGKRNVPLGTYLSRAMTEIGSLAPSGQDIFISGCNYSFTPNENTFDINVEWTYYLSNAPGLFV